MWPFKQPYKKVKFDLYAQLDPALLLYLPLQNSGNWPWSLIENLAIIPEEKNVLIKKIVVDCPPLNNLYPIVFWKLLFNFLDRSETEKLPVRGNIQNATSGAFLPPAGSPNYFTSCNSYKPSNNYDDGIIAGGLNFRYFETKSSNNLSAPLFFNTINFTVSIYYKDIDE